MMYDILAQALEQWSAPGLPEEMPRGDVPGDIVNLSEGVIRNAQTLFPLLMKQILQLEEKPARVVVAITGGSGSGKSCVGSILTWYFRQLNIGIYLMSGDNYPRRIPAENDAERERIFRVGGLKALLEAGEYNSAVKDVLDELWKKGLDSDPVQCVTYPWLSVYQQGGREDLALYLGTDLEQDYEELSEILKKIRRGDNRVFMKRMGRTPLALSYEEVDLAGVEVVLLEWTHGSSGLLQGVDIPILLNSTPEETKAYRVMRGRDGNADSPFVTMVLEIEQKKIEDRAPYARIILEKTGAVTKG